MIGSSVIWGIFLVGMISERTMWDERYEEEASRIPVVEDGQNVDTKWMSEMDDLANADAVMAGSHEIHDQRTDVDGVTVSPDGRTADEIDRTVVLMNQDRIALEETVALVGQLNFLIIHDYCIWLLEK